MSKTIHASAAPQGLVHDQETHTASGAITLKNGGLVIINNAANIALTFNETPTVGSHWVFWCQATNNGSTVTLPDGVLWDTTAGHDVATFDADDEKLEAVMVTTTRMLVISNPDSVAFS